VVPVVPAVVLAVAVPPDVVVVAVLRAVVA
jgi:hypothetical protein